MAIIIGTVSDDTLFGTPDDDTLVGGAGNDYMQGGAGNDTYVLEATGNDYVSDLNYSTPWSAELNTLDFSAVSLADNKQIVVMREGDNLRLDIFDPMMGGMPQGSVVVDQYFNPSNTINYQLKLAETTVSLNRQQLQQASWNSSPLIIVQGGTANNDQMNGWSTTSYVFLAGAGDDLLQGGTANDTLVGGAGNDYMQGGAGNDTYVLEATGNDYVSDFNYGTPWSAELNTLDFSAVSLADNKQIVVMREGDNLRLDIFDPMMGGMPQGSVVVDQYFNPSNTINYQLKLAETTVSLNRQQLQQASWNSSPLIIVQGGTANNDQMNGWSTTSYVFLAGAGDDLLQGGTANDTLVGGAGNDYMQGGAGNDTYVLEATGNDYVSDFNYGTPWSAELNTLDFSAVSLADNKQIVVMREGDNLRLDIFDPMMGGMPQGSVVVDQYFNPSNTINYQLKLAETTVSLNRQQLQQASWNSSPLIIVQGGTANNDQMNGWSTTSYVFLAGAGDDLLQGGTANDTLVGGAGNDYMQGGAGNDTYVLEATGNDYVSDFNYGTPWSAELNTLDFSAVSLADNKQIVVMREGDNLRLDIFDPMMGGMPQGSVVVDQYFNPSNTINYQLKLAETTVSLNRQQLQQASWNSSPLIIVQGGTANNDQMNGWSTTSYVFLAGAGDDLLQGGTANDTLVGGAGNDYMQGGAGNDTYVLEATGNDYVSDFNYGTPWSAELNTLDFSSLLLDGNKQIVFSRGWADALSINISDTLTGNFLQIGSVTIDQYFNASNVADYQLKLADATVLLNRQQMAQISYGTSLAVIIGGEGGEAIYTSGGSLYTNVLVGGAGNDILNGGAGSDTLVGGAGNDYMQGGAGNDTYVLEATGQDFVSDYNYGPSSAQLNTLDFSVVSLANNKQIVAMRDGDNLRLDILDLMMGGMPQGGVIVDQYFNLSNRADYQLKLADTTVLLNRQQLEKISLSSSSLLVIQGGTEGNDFIAPPVADISGVLLGGAGDDILQAGAGEDTLVGGQGNDVFMGGAGNDTYVLSFTINETDTVLETLDILLPQLTELNTLDLSNASLENDKQIVAVREGENLRITMMDSMMAAYQPLGSVLVDRYFNPANMADYQLKLANTLISLDRQKLIQAANSAPDINDPLLIIKGGTAGDDTVLVWNSVKSAVLLGGSGNDVLVATSGDSTLIGGQGNDSLIGGEGDVNYVLQADGNDFISDSNISGINTLDFSNVLLEGNKQIITTIGGVSGYGLRLDILDVMVGEVPQGSVTIDQYLNNPVNIESYKLKLAADTTIALRTTPLLIQSGGLGDDQLSLIQESYDAVGVLLGGVGNDTLLGGVGNDILNGGVGNDILNGGFGNDTYILQATGNDVISEGYSGNINTLDFSSVALDGLQIVAIRDGDNLRFDIINPMIGVLPQGSVTIDQYFNISYNQNPFYNDFQLKLADTTVLFNRAQMASVSNPLVIQGGTAIAEQISVPWNPWENNYAVAVLLGAGGDDSLLGGSGNDTLIGGAGNDTLNGGWGNDTYVMQQTGDDIISDVGLNTLDFSNVSLLGGKQIVAMRNGDSLRLDIIDPVVGSTPQGSVTLDQYFNPPNMLNVDYQLKLAETSVLLNRQQLTQAFLNGSPLFVVQGGTASNDQLTLFVGDSNSVGILLGGAGDDLLVGGDGADTLIGGRGNDTFSAGAGDDLLVGGDGADTAIYGSWVDNDITGDESSATVTNASGVDLLVDVGYLSFNGVLVSTHDAFNDAPLAIDDTNGSNVVIEADLNVIGDATATGNVLNNDFDEDRSLGLGETTTVSAVAGLSSNVDVLVEGVYGSVTISAYGWYTYTLNNSDIDTNALIAGQTVIDSFSYTIIDAHGATDTARLDITITGSDDNVSIVNGTNANDWLIGTLSDDVVNGFAGDDSLNGDGGADTLVGGIGDDRYYIDSNDDVVVELANEGIDTIVTGQSYELTANLEKLVLIDGGDFTGIGNELNNSLTGNSGNNLLSGALGDDTLDGGEGNDTLLGGDGTDTAIYNLWGWGGVTVLGNSSVATVMGIDGLDSLESIENLSFNGIVVSLSAAVNDAPIGVNDTNSGDAVIEALVLLLLVMPRQQAMS
jgi:VCBS repeat-containing protein